MTARIPLKRLAQLRYGDSLPSEARVDGPVPVMGSGGVSGFHNVANTDRPAIVVGRKGSYGLVHWAPEGAFVIDTAYAIDRSNSRVDLRWLYYVLQAVDLLGPSQDVGVPGLSREFAHHVLIPQPPPPEEQQRIADFLDAETGIIDRLVGASSRQVELIGSRFIEYARDATTRGLSENLISTGISWMPFVGEENLLYRIGRHFRTGSGTTPRSDSGEYFSGSHLWVNTADLRDSEVHTTAKMVTDLALQRYPTLRMYEPGALVVAMYGATIGRLGILSARACTNQACCVLYEPTAVGIEYAFYWFLSHRNEIVRLGAGGGQPNIGQDLIRSLVIPAPPGMSEQRRIAGAISERKQQANAEQALIDERIRLLVERRKALITDAVTGELTAQGGVQTGRSYQ